MTNCENFDDGLTRVAPAGAFKAVDNPTQKIKEIEKEIEKLNSLEKRKEGQLVTLPSTYKYELLKAKLSVYKEWEEKKLEAGK